MADLANLPSQNRDYLLADVHQQQEDEEVLRLNKKISLQARHIQRMEAMLSHYQKLLPVQDITFEPPGQVGPEEAGLFVNDYAMLSECEPLFQAYEQLLARQQREFEKCVRERQELDQENRALARQLELTKERLYQKSQELGRLMDEVKGQNGAAVAAMPGEIQAVGKMSEIFKKQQDSLLDELDILKTQNLRLERVALEKEEQFDSLRNKADEATTLYQGLRKDKEALVTEVEILKANLSKEQETISQLEREKLRVTGQVMDLSKKVEFLEEQRNQFQSAYNDMGSKKANTLDLLSKENATLALKEKDLTTRVHLLQREIQDYKAENSRTKRDLDMARADCDHMVKLIEDNEGRIANYDQREKQVQQLKKDATTKIQQAETDKEVAELKVEQLEKKLAKGAQQYRQDIIEREQAFKRMQEAVRVKQKSQLDSKEEEISVLHSQLESIKSEHDRVLRDLEATRIENQRYEKAFTEDGSKMDTTVKEHARKLAETEATHSREVSDLKEEIQKLRDAEHLLSLKKNEQEVELGEVRAELDALRKDAEIMSDEKRELKAHIVESRVMKDSLRDEIVKMKELHALKLHEITEDYNMRVTSSENEAVHAKERAKVVEERALAILQQQERLTEKWKRENQDTKAYFTKIIKKLYGKNKNLEDKLKL